jgi:predicted Fe-Mo cluster-binding NifX family protein
LTNFTAWLNPFRSDVNTPALLESAIIKENVDVLVTSQISAEAASKISTAGINLVTKNGGTVFDLIDEVRGE